MEPGPVLFHLHARPDFDTINEMILGVSYDILRSSSVRQGNT